MAQVGDMVSPTNLAREFDLPLKFLVPPSIIISLVIILILLHIPTQFVLSSLLPFWVDECTESTSSDWVGVDEFVAYPVTYWFIDKF